MAPSDRPEDTAVRDRLHVVAGAPRHARGGVPGAAARRPAPGADVDSPEITAWWPAGPDDGVRAHPTRRPPAVDDAPRPEAGSLPRGVDDASGSSRVAVGVAPDEPRPDDGSGTDPLTAWSPAPEPPGSRGRHRLPSRSLPRGDPDDVPWLPPPPSAAGGTGGDEGPPAAVDPDTLPDVAAVAARSRSEALASAAAQYTAAYGHPVDGPRGRDEPTGGRRWWLSTRHAVVAAIAVVVLVTGVVLRATVDVPADRVPLASTEHAGTTAPAEVASEPRADAEVGAPGPSVGGPGAADDVAGRVRAAVPVTGTAPAAAPQAGATGPLLVVHVVGQVASPGVLTLPAGSRVGDAVAAAGGARPGADLAGVNLARLVVDGEQIHVPAPGEAPRPAPAGGAVGAPSVGPAGAGPSTPAAPAPAAPVSLNSADLAMLDALPGIGPVLAQRILDWRAAHGPFRSVEELREVTGIGDAVLTRLRPLVTV